MSVLPSGRLHPQPSHQGSTPSPKAQGKQRRTEFASVRGRGRLSGQRIERHERQFDSIMTKIFWINHAQTFGLIEPPSSFTTGPGDAEGQRWSET
jgi:hypothetical protein